MLLVEAVVLDTQYLRHAIPVQAWQRRTDISQLHACAETRSHEASDPEERQDRDRTVEAARHPEVSVKTTATRTK